MGDGIDNRNVGAGQQWQVIIGLDVRRLDEPDLPRIDNDKFGALAQALFHLRREYRVSFGRVGSNDNDHVGVHHAIERLRSGRCSQGLVQAVAGRRMANTRTRVDIVVAHGCTHQLLYDVNLFVGAPG